MDEYNKLNSLINEADSLREKNVTASSPEFNAWHIKVLRFLSNKYGDDSVEVKQFEGTQFSKRILKINATPQEKMGNDICACRDGLETTQTVLKDYLKEIAHEKKNSISNVASQASMDLSKVFIVHGHDGELKESVARIVEKQNIEAIILSEQVNNGMTIIEKFEKNSDVGCAICLFTDDDFGRAKADDDDKPRARQNVVFEAGYFIGKLGRDRIIILSDSGIEIPSDLAGVVYTNTQNWQVELLKELKSMGYNIDFNKLF